MVSPCYLGAFKPSSLVWAAPESCVLCLAAHGLPVASLHRVSKVQGETRDGEEAEQKTLCVYSVSTR